MFPCRKKILNIFLFFLDHENPVRYMKNKSDLRIIQCMGVYIITSPASKHYHVYRLMDRGLGPVGMRHLMGQDGIFKVYVLTVSL